MVLDEGTRVVAGAGKGIGTFIGRFVVGLCVIVIIFGVLGQLGGRVDTLGGMCFVLVIVVIAVVWILGASAKAGVEVAADSMSNKWLRTYVASESNPLRRKWRWNVLRPLERLLKQRDPRRVSAAEYEALLHEHERAYGSSDGAFAREVASFLAWIGYDEASAPPVSHRD